MTEELKPKDHAEAVALFRAQVLGPLVCRDWLGRGERAGELRALSREAWRPPGAAVSRSYSVTTLERWYYLYRHGGFEALKPERRSDRGYAQALSEEQEALVLDVRRDHPRVSAALILRTLEADGRLPEGVLTEATLRRLYRAHGLDRRTLHAGDREPRRRWAAARPNALWHADVCHGPALRIDGRAMPLRIHAILDDKSRFVVALEACTTEREVEMLRLLVKALRLHGAPDVLYLDNGPTYSGQALATACTRLGIALVHARPHDPQARGKMERFWRTLREQCLDHLGGLGSLHEVQVRLLAWLTKHYHATAHSALMGKGPGEVYAAEPSTPVSEAMLREALIVRGRRRIRRDGTVSVGGQDFELEQGYLAGRQVTIGRSLLDPTELPWVEHEEQRFELLPVDPTLNAKRKKPHRPKTGIDAIPFDPPGALVAQLVAGGAR
jgi:putative transposase